MAAKARIRHRVDQYAALRHDPKVQKLCEELAAKAADAANAQANVPGARYEAQDDSLTYRGGASVHPANYKARLDNARNNTLLSSLGGCG